jgi:hypothetical protein
MVKSKARSYEMSEKQVRGKYTLEYKLEALTASNADVLLSAVTPKFGAATIRKVHELC